MKKSFLFIILSILSLNLMAQEYQMRTCYDDLLYDDGTNSTNQTVGNTAGLVTSGLALAGSPLAAVSATVMLSAYGIDWVKGGQISRLTRLIEESEDKIEDPQAETGKLLARTVRKINRRVDKPLTEFEFAKLIDKANKDRSLCQGSEYLTIARMKRQARKTDDVAFLDSDTNLKTELDINSESSSAEIDSSASNTIYN